MQTTFAKLMTLAACVSGLLLPIAADAQDQRVIDQLVAGTCNSFLAPILGKKEIAILVAERSIDAAAVCPCASGNVHGDPRLAPFLAMPDDAFVKAVEPAPVRSYVIGRVLQSVIQCFSQELDSTLKASTAIK